MLRRPSIVVCPSTIFKDVLLQNCWASWSQSSSGASMGQGNESLFGTSGSHDQDGRHAHVLKKPFKNLLLRNQRANDLGPWYIALGPWAHQSLFKWWPWVDLDLFYGKVKFGPLRFYMGKSVRKSFNGRNLQQMTTVTWGICLHKNSDPKALSAPVPGLYTCIKKWKIMYKIKLQRYFFWNLQQMGKVTRLFCWHQDFVHKGLSTPAPGLYTCGKTLKSVYKIIIQRDWFETCNKWSNW